MKLAVVSKYPPSIEGVSEYARHVVQNLAGRPEVNRITVIANRSGSNSGDSGPTIEVRRAWLPGEAGAATRILGEVVRLKPDAVWYNVGLSMFGGTALATCGFALPAISRSLGIRSVVTLHEERIDQLGDLGVPDGLLRRTGLRAAVRLLLLSDVVCVTTDRHRRALEQRRICRRARIVHLPLCGYAEPALESPREPATILMLTTHAPHKGLPLLIEAVRQVRGSIPNARLLVAGVDHPRFPGYLQEIRRQYAAEPAVEWIGPVSEDDLRSTFSRATIAVVPYRVATGSSATVHQAVGAGRPVVATDLPDFRSMAEEENLWLEFFPQGNRKRLAQALAALLCDPARRQAIARHNLESAHRHSLAATGERYLRLFQNTEGPRPSIAVSGWPSGALSR